MFIRLLYLIREIIINYQTSCTNITVLPGQHNYGISTSLRVVVSRQVHKKHNPYNL